MRVFSILEVLSVLGGAFCFWGCFRDVGPSLSIIVGARGRKESGVSFQKVCKSGENAVA